MAEFLKLGKYHSFPIHSSNYERPFLIKNTIEAFCEHNLYEKLYQNAVKELGLDRFYNIKPKLNI